MKEYVATMQRCKSKPEGEIVEEEDENIFENLSVVSFLHKSVNVCDKTNVLPIPKKVLFSTQD